MQVALGPTAPLEADKNAEAAVEKRREALTELRAWYDDWASTAKAVVKKKGNLVRLGLATRKAPTKKAKPASKPAPVVAKPAAEPAKASGEPAKANGESAKPS
ncbi:MAG: hypothetical protein QM820_37615 [Minicystis sp.]